MDDIGRICAPRYCLGAGLYTFTGLNVPVGILSGLCYGGVALNKRVKEVWVKHKLKNPGILQVEKEALSKRLDRAQKRRNECTSKSKICFISAAPLVGPCIAVINCKVNRP